MTETELEAIEERAAKATPGPWNDVGVDITTGGDLYLNDAAKWPVDTRKLATDSDYDFVAHAREDVPGLITEVRRLREAALYYLDTLVEVSDMASHDEDVHPGKPRHEIAKYASEVIDDPRYIDLLRR